MLIYDLDTDPGLGSRIAERLDAQPAPHESRHFEDGECKVRPLDDPCGGDAYVVQGLHGGPRESPHDRLCRLLMFAATLRDHGADRVTAVVPYLAYARKDRRTKPYDPLGCRYVAQLLESVGIAQLIVLEPHNPAAVENAFRIPVRVLPSHLLFDEWARTLPAGPLAVASPDPGGVKRAQLWREHLEATLRRPVSFAIVDKRRSEGHVGGEDLVAGDVDQAVVVVVDDLVATGHTLLRAAHALRARGARQVLACAAHGLFVGDAGEALGDPVLDRIVVGDGVPAFRVGPASPLRGKLEVVSCAGLLADAIRDSHAGWMR